MEKKIKKGQKIKITEAHLKLAQRMYVDWDSYEYGAPAIDCKRPYGNSDVEKDILEILGLPYPEDGELPEHLSDYARQIHEEMRDVLQVCLQLQKFEVGTYELGEDYNARSWFKSN